jgi:hypothetical protein
MTAREWLNWGLVLGVKWGLVFASLSALAAFFGDEFWFGAGILSLVLGFPLSLVTVTSLTGMPLFLAFIWVPFVNAVLLGLLLGVLGSLQGALKRT